MITALCLAIFVLLLIQVSLTIIGRTKCFCEMPESAFNGDWEDGDRIRVINIGDDCTASYNLDTFSSSSQFSSSSSSEFNTEFSKQTFEGSEADFNNWLKSEGKWQAKFDSDKHSESHDFHSSESSESHSASASILAGFHESKFEASSADMSESWSSWQVSIRFSSLPAGRG